MRQESFNWVRTIETLGILSVIGSLFIVAWEIRQNTNVARSATMQAVSEMSYDAAMRLVDNSELRDAFLGAASGADLTDEQFLQMQWFVAAILRVQQNRYNQILLGIVDKEQALQMGGRAGIYVQPFFREFWDLDRNNYPLDFQEYMEQEVFHPSKQEY